MVEIPKIIGILTMRLNPELLKKSGVFGVVSAELVGYVAAGFGLGWFIDGLAGTKPIFSAILTIVGLAAAIRRILVWMRSQ
jgi:F0F1-type ATP synthase assembly protein I